MRPRCPKASFYTHFDSKERFGAEVLGRYWEQRADRALAILSDEARSPLDRLKAYFASKTQVSGSSGKGCMIGNFSAELAGEKPACPRPAGRRVRRLDTDARELHP